MRKGILSPTTAAAVMTLGLTACGGDGATTAAPSDAASLRKRVRPRCRRRARSGSSCRTASPPPAGDRGPSVSRGGLQGRGRRADIQNAQGDKSKFQTIADHMINKASTS